MSEETVAERYDRIRREADEVAAEQIAEIERRTGIMIGFRSSRAEAEEASARLTSAMRGLSVDREPVIPRRSWWARLRDWTKGKA